MQVTARSYLTSGLAVLGAGAIALSPIQPLPDHTSPARERAVSNLAVNLASSIDPITPWVDTFQTAVANIQALAAFYAEKPFPLLQTVGANIGTYIDELANGNAGQIPGQIQNNIQTFFQAPWWNRDGATIVNDAFSSNYISGTQTASGLSASVFNNQRSAYNTVASTVAGQLGDLGPALVQFTATPYSGQLAGLISSVLSSLVQLTRSFTAVGQYFQDGDLIGAINELINIPANSTNAFLNGIGALDLTAVVVPLLPPALAPLVQSIGLNLGGLITPPVPFNGSLTAANNPPTQFTGGTLFDIVSARTRPVAGVGGTTTGLPASWFGSVIGLGQFLAPRLLVTPTPPPPTAAAAAPKAAAAADAAPDATATVAPAAPEEMAPSEPATEAAPIAEETAPSAPADEAPPAPADASAPGAEAPAAEAPEAPARAHRGGGRGTSDTGGNSSGRGHRGAA